VSDRLLTTREVAAFLGLSPETVLRRYRAGELPGYRLGSNVLRFRESEIEAWLDSLHALDRGCTPGILSRKYTREWRQV
jgi:excisionase family DNA binding protein